jgi:hypothetical protein
MTDDELDAAIHAAKDQADGDGVPALIAVRDRLQAERDVLDPGLGRVWDALVDLADRVDDDIPQLLALSEGRARWLAAARGPTDPEVIRAWRTIADVADSENEWDIATRAWLAIAGTPIDSADRASLLSVSLALRGLAGRKLADDEDDHIADARALAERDLAVTERLWPDGHAQVALSLENLAAITARLGDRAAARAYRERQRELLIKTGGSPSQLAKVDAQLAQLA